jgi:hypothetical protein
VKLRSCRVDPFFDDPQVSFAAREPRRNRRHFQGCKGRTCKGALAGRRRLRGVRRVPGGTRAVDGSLRPDFDGVSLCLGTQSPMISKR